jgi:hypothetical protein
MTELTGASCTWALFLASLSGSVVGWLVVTGLMLVLERLWPPGEDDDR